MKAARKANERRKKVRFPIQRQMRYKLLDAGKIVSQGRGETVDISSNGLAFEVASKLPVGSYVEVAVSWPVLLDDSCPMQLTVFGRVTRFDGTQAACTVEKWEFRTQARELRQVIPMREDGMLSRWADYRKDVSMKAGVAATA